jgi:hypothetical protein
MKSPFATQTCFLTAAVFTLLFAIGCASLTSGPTQRFEFYSDPPGATITFNGKTIGTTPLTNAVPRTETAKIVISKDGCTKTVIKRANMNPAVIGNLVSFFIIGVIYDYATGAFYKFKDPVVHVELVPGPDPGLEFWRQMWLAGGIPTEEFHRKVEELWKNGKIDEKTKLEELQRTK